MMASGVHKNELKEIERMNLEKTTRVGCGIWSDCVNGLWVTVQGIGGL